MKSRNRATWIGLSAILLWASVMGMIRRVSQELGPEGGAALIYTLAAALLLLTQGWPRLKQMPRHYLGWGSLLLVSYELCLCQSIGHAHSSRQAIDVIMINYLWPSFTMLASILVNRQPVRLLLIPGLLLSLLGIAWVLGGRHGFDPSQMLASLHDNPMSCGLAFMAALLWAAYSMVTNRYAQGQNGISLFFVLLAAALWIRYLLAGAPDMHWTGAAWLHVIWAATAIGFGYAAWNIGLLHGHVALLAGASYFTPVLSAALAASLLGVPLSSAFWIGTAMICAGALLCWWATRMGSQPLPPTADTLASST
ncbi:aromatic amino acid DMT transporter YddG [Frateuria aurantia]